MNHFQEVYLLSGSNIEPRLKYLDKADSEINRRIGKIITTSKIYESEPWGFDDENMFLNKVLNVATRLSAEEILKEILEIEKSFGRLRVNRLYSSRTIDIDILYYGDEIIKTERLTVPHPRLHQRRFTMLPLNEIASDLIHPGFQKTNNTLLKNLDDTSKVWIYQQQKV